MFRLRHTAARLWAWVVRLFGRSPPSQPSRTVDGVVWSVSGWLQLAPWVLPRRSYRLRLPVGFDNGRRWPLLVLIHGCRQTPDEFAAGTRIAELADRFGVVVLMPCQTRFANPARCWNWFVPGTVSGLGESALVLAQIRTVIREYPIDESRMGIAGLSSGAAPARTQTPIGRPIMSRTAVVAGGIGRNRNSELQRAEVSSY